MLEQVSIILVSNSFNTKIIFLLTNVLVIYEKANDKKVWINTFDILLKNSFCKKPSEQRNCKRFILKTSQLASQSLWTFPMVKMLFVKWFIFGLFVSMIESKIDSKSDSKSDLKSGQRDGKSKELFLILWMPFQHILYSTM